MTERANRDRTLAERGRNCVSINGTDLLDGEIGNPLNKERAVARYTGTPSYDPNDVPAARSAHIGNGVWLTRCHLCDGFMRTYGSLYMPLQRHWYEEHRLSVPILPSA